MLTLCTCLPLWPSSTFSSALKRELESLPSGSLPLEHGVTRCGMVDDSRISVTVISTDAENNTILVKIGVFFTEIVAGCVCGEDPVDENAYCELLINIDRATGQVRCEPASP